jgi:hypothetical protein
MGTACTSSSDSAALSPSLDASRSRTIGPTPALLLVVGARDLAFCAVDASGEIRRRFLDAGAAVDKSDVRFGCWASR